MLSAIMKPNRKQPASPSPRRRVEVIDVTAPVPGASTYLPFLHVPDEKTRTRPATPGTHRSPTFDRDLQRVLDIFAN